MGGRERKFAPRLRTTRPLGETLTTNTPPSQPLPVPEKRDGAWYLPAPLAQRLHEKSALGTPTSDGGIRLTTEEVMFCHWYRHVPLPEPVQDWFEQEAAVSPSLATRTVAMDILRNGGELVVPKVHLQERFSNLHPATWAVRWERHEAWTKHSGFSQVRVHHTNDPLDWDELHAWVTDVTASNHVPELCVVDDEFDATVYHLTLVEPSGQHRSFEDLSEEERNDLKHACSLSQPMAGGHFISTNDGWPLPAVGVEHFSGRFLRNEELNHFMESLGGQPSSVYDDLCRRGLLLRPGFKYGCKWRAYEKTVHVEHAPWLVQPRSDAPQNWEEMCLAVRLAEGVNKRWLCAVERSGTIFYLNILRNA